MPGRSHFAILACAALLAACGGSKAPASSSAVTPAVSGQAVQVLYAGSLVNLMEKGIGPAFKKVSGASYQGQGAGSVALANAIRDKTKTADVFISADPAVNASLMGAANGNWVDWYVLFARTSMVIGYNPKSQFAAGFAKAKAGALPWYQVLEEPGLKLGRTDPNLDPKGYHTLFLFDLAQDYYRVPNLHQKLLGADANPAQVFPEETLESRLEAGALDAGFFYLNETVEKNLPYITLPDEINQSQPAMAAAYGRVSWNNAKGQTVKGSPILYTATVLNQAKDPAAAAAFVQYLLSSAGQA
ncbi:MAG TPA: extracellular solute-binding protein, partial [Chloroflexota bacterium]|nr:extracellular solute-binding protein [Chloroflexota bacterium]